jgi:hypothetical protein
MGRLGLASAGSGEETDDGLLWMRKWTLGFHKMRGISLLTEDLFGMDYTGLFHTPESSTAAFKLG